MGGFSLETNFNNPQDEYGVGGYDISAELEKMKNEGSGYDIYQQKPVKQGLGGKMGSFFEDKKKILTYAGIVGAILTIVIISFFFIFQNKKSVESNSKESQIQTQNNDAKTLFKTSIQTAVNAQEAKGNISKKWRVATVEYSKTQDLNTFKETLNQVNEERTSYIEKIKTDDNELNNLVINALNNQREFLNKAYNVDNSVDAISIYNEWNSGDKVYDEEYNTVLKKLLTDVGIKYTEKQNSDGGVVIEY